MSMAEAAQKVVQLCIRKNTAMSALCRHDGVVHVLCLGCLGTKARVMDKARFSGHDTTTKETVHHRRHQLAKVVAAGETDANVVG